MHFKCLVPLFLAGFGLNQTVLSFNLITFIKNWSLRDSSNIPMPKGFMDVHKLITREGYGYESYYVTTEDGYILKMTRLVPRNNHRGKRPPVLMVHGVIAISDIWVLRGKNQDLGFLLSQLGFDVWFVDTRGNAYSKNHKYLSSKYPRYWDFSFHETGLYDLPAATDFVLMKTGASRIGMIGHSMGTTIFLVFASLRPEYNRKLWGVALLAPVGYKVPLEQMLSSSLRLAITQGDLLYEYITSAGIYEILPRTPRLIHSANKLCSYQPEQNYCFDLIAQLAGENRGNVEKKHVIAYMTHTPAGASARTLHHLSQVYRFGFKLYDFGPKINMQKYNSTIPPKYPLHQITAPVMFIYGQNDFLTNAQGVKWLANSIPGVKIAKSAADPRFNHLDFLLGMNTNTTVYKDVTNFFMKYAMF